MELKAAWAIACDLIRWARNPKNKRYISAEIHGVTRNGIRSIEPEQVVDEKGIASYAAYIIRIGDTEYRCTDEQIEMIILS